MTRVVAKSLPLRVPDRLRSENPVVSSLPYCTVVVRHGQPAVGSNAAHCQNWSARPPRVAGSARTSVVPPVNALPPLVDWLIRMSLLHAPGVLTPS